MALVRVTYGKGTPTERTRIMAQRAYEDLVAEAHRGTEPRVSVPFHNTQELIHFENEYCRDHKIHVEAELIEA